MPYGIYEAYGKRPLDIFFSAFSLLALSPLLAVTAALVRKNLGTPVIFAQKRPGRIDKKTGKEKIFTLYKFRTMTDRRDADGNLLPDEERLTSFGRKLRSTSLDELPELFNILKGDMSFVGPRPLLVEYLPYYTETERRRHEVRPGLTGLAQVSGRNLLAWDERFRIDVTYVDHITFKTDCHIILLTLKKVWERAGVVEITGSEEPNMAEERLAKKNVT